MRKLLYRGLAIAFLVVVVFYSYRDQITVHLSNRQSIQDAKADQARPLSDGLYVAVCGAGSPLPVVNHAGTCIAVIAGSRMYIVDAGANGARNLQKMRLPESRASAILLTHLHSDHVDGLGEMLKMYGEGRDGTISTRIFGPTGVTQIVAGFIAADGFAESASPAARPFKLPAPGELHTVLDKHGLKISVFSLDQLQVDPAVGYRFDYKGRSVVISGDTQKIPGVVKAAKDVDLLVHEAFSPKLVGVITSSAETSDQAQLLSVTRDMLADNATPVQAAEIASDAGAHFLLLYHVVPALGRPGLTRVFLKGMAAKYTGPVRLSRDGTFVSLPTGKHSISITNLLPG